MPMIPTKVQLRPDLGDLNLAAFTSVCAATRTAVGDGCIRIIHVGETMHFPVEFPSVKKCNVRNTMLRLVLSISLLSLSMSSGAFAQARSGTPEEQKACTRDVQRFCRPVIDQGDFTILACLKENRPKLTAECEQVLKTHNQ